MPTTDIIGYLWHNRQELDLDGLPDVLTLVADLQRQGLECVRVNDVVILGQTAGTSVQLIRHENEEWEKLVHDAIVSGSVEHAVHMIDRERDV